MSILKTIKAQLGLSATPANNFTMDASADNGTMKLARGNAGATTQDIMTVGADGKVTFPNSPGLITNKGVFSAKNNASQATASNTWTTVLFQAEEFDTNGWFNSTTGVFKPTVAGYYSLTCSISYNSSITMALAFLKNADTANRRQLYYGAATYMASGSSIMYLNGTTDFVSVQAYSAGVIGTLQGAVSPSYFQGEQIL